MASSASGPRAVELHIQPDMCPDNVCEVADLYTLGRLAADEERNFEDHYLTCPNCARAVQLAHEFVVAIRLAGEGRLGRSR